MCVLALCGRVRRAGLPGALWCASTFSFGRFVFLLCSAPSGLGLPPSLPLPLPFLVALALCFGCFSRPPAAWLFVRSRLVCVSRLAVGCFVVVPPPPSLFVSRGFWRSCLVPWWCFFFFFFFFLFSPFFPFAPPLSPAFSGFRPRVPWASALCVVCFVGLLPPGSPCACPSFVLSAWLVVAPRRLQPPPPSLLSRGFRRCRSALWCAVEAARGRPGVGVFVGVLEGYPGVGLSSRREYGRSPRGVAGVRLPLGGTVWWQNIGWALGSGTTCIGPCTACPPVSSGGAVWPRVSGVGAPGRCGGGCLVARVQALECPRVLCRTCSGGSPV